MEYPRYKVCCWCFSYNQAEYRKEKLTTAEIKQKRNVFMPPI